MKLAHSEVVNYYKNKSMYENNPRAFKIVYMTPNATGTMLVDTKYYARNIKKFSKLLKDCNIIKFEEVDKSEEGGQYGN